MSGELQPGRTEKQLLWEQIARLTAERDRLLNLSDIGEELAGHAIRPLALGLPPDAEVLRYWGIKYMEAKRAALAEGGDTDA